MKFYERELVTGFRPQRHMGKCRKLLCYAIQNSKLDGVPGYEDGAYNINNTDIHPQIHSLRYGGFMEGINDLITEVTTTMKEGKAELEDLANKVQALSEIVTPLLTKQITELRSARMAVVSELNQCLGALREVRKFFLEANYDIEMVRMERFVKLCTEIKALKQDGTLDAICDSAIRLALKEVNEDQR